MREGRTSVAVKVEGLEALTVERSTARTRFINARFRRDAAAVYYDSVVDESATVTKHAWDAFSVKQSEMDLAGDHFNVASGAVIDYMMQNDE
jgi:hypothetical protein